MLNLFRGLHHLTAKSADLQRLGVACICVCVLVGCGRTPSDPATETPESAADANAELTKPLDSEHAGPREYEASAAELLASRLPADEAADGWIRLFDGHTLFGWEIAGEANWHVADGTISVDSGAPCLLCTSIPWHDYELTLEFNADPQTNSGVFLRTPLEPEDPATDCLEVNIAPDSNPFPTASVVGRIKAEANQLPEQTFNTWRRMTMRLQGENLVVNIDGNKACELDAQGLVGGRIGLQKNEGRIAFRDIRLRPLGLRSMLDEGLDQWKRYPEMPGSFQVNDEGWLHVVGGKTQLESRDTFGDFNLLAEYKMDDAANNSGIFFRCIPGDEMMGYECQISNETIDGDPLRPADAGTGGIFRRQDARVVAGEPGEWATVLLAARGPRFAAWVNGVQVSDVYDDRSPDENPRSGLRLRPGTLMIQGHDEQTDVLYRQLLITEFPQPNQAE